MTANSFNNRLLEMRLRRYGSRRPQIIKDIIADLDLRLSITNRQFSKPVIFGGFNDIITETIIKSPAFTSKPAQIASLKISDDISIAEPQFDCLISICYLNMLASPGEILRILKHIITPGGLIIAAIIGGDSLRQLQAALTNAELKRRQGAANRIMPMVSLHDLGNILRDSGLPNPVTDSEQYELSYPDGLSLLRDIRLFGGNIAMDSASNPPLTRQIIKQLEVEYKASHNSDQTSNRLNVAFDVLWLTSYSQEVFLNTPDKAGQAS